MDAPRKWNWPDPNVQEPPESEMCIQTSDKCIDCECAQRRIDELKTALLNVRDQERERYEDALVFRATRTQAIEKELENIAHAKRENFEDAEEFRQWAQNRARNALGE